MIRSRVPNRSLAFGSSVLVAYEHFGVATAIAQRVMEFAAVELARTEDALAHPEQGRGYDLVVHCPYISGAPRRTAAMELLTALGKPVPASEARVVTGA